VRKLTGLTVRGVSTAVKGGHQRGVAVTVSIRDQAGARAEAAGTLELELPSALTLRDLIRTRVREEVAKANAAALRGESFRTLVQPVDAEVTLNGYRLHEGRTIDWERQAAKAEEAFGSNGFFVLVDGRQVEELDEVLALSADSDVRFVRLTPLVGG
jgi:hypothetical protein